MYVISCSMYCP